MLEDWDDPAVPRARHKRNDHAGDRLGVIAVGAPDDLGVFDVRADIGHGRKVYIKSVALKVSAYGVAALICISGITGGSD